MLWLTTMRAVAVEAEVGTTVARIEIRLDDGCAVDVALDSKRPRRLWRVRGRGDARGGRQRRPERR
jgi:hypothetical protein